MARDTASDTNLDRTAVASGSTSEAVSSASDAKLENQALQDKEKIGLPDDLISLLSGMMAADNMPEQPLPGLTLAMVSEVGVHELQAVAVTDGVTPETIMPGSMVALLKAAPVPGQALQHDASELRPTSIVGAILNQSTEQAATLDVKPLPAAQAVGAAAGSLPAPAETALPLTSQTAVNASALLAVQVQAAAGNVPIDNVAIDNAAIQQAQSASMQSVFHAMQRNASSDVLSAVGVKVQSDGKTVAGAKHETSIYVQPGIQDAATISAVINATVPVTQRAEGASLVEGEGVADVLAGVKSSAQPTSADGAGPTIALQQGVGVPVDKPSVSFHDLTQAQQQTPLVVARGEGYELVRNEQGDVVTRSLPLQSGRQAVTDQVRVHVQQAIQHGVDQVSVKLNPPMLGHVHIKMQTGADGLTHIHMIASSPEALDALRHDARDLARALQDAGIRADTGSMQFDLREQPREGRGFMQYEGHTGNGAGYAGAETDDEASPLPVMPPGYMLSSERVLDICV